MRTREDLAWAAGLFEGEGCIGGRADGRRRYIALTLHMKDFDAVRRFKAVMGFGSFFERTPHQQNWSPTLGWKVADFEHAQAAIAMMWPWLCSRRRATAKRLLLAYTAQCSTRDRAKAIHGRIWDALRKGGQTQRSIAREFGVSEPYISQLKARL